MTMIANLSGTELTKREIEILDLFAKGKTRHEAASELGISHHTCSSHAKRIYLRLGVNSKTQAVVKAIRLGYVEAN